MLRMPPQTTEAARIWKDGHINYGGSEFYADGLQAEASAIRAWRNVKALTCGAAFASHMFLEKDRLQCLRATIGEGRRYFVQGGPCRASRAPTHYRPNMHRVCKTAPGTGYKPRYSAFAPADAAPAVSSTAPRGASAAK